MPSVCQSFCAAALAAAASLVALVLPAPAAVIFDGSGTSALGRPVAFRATLAISGSTLEIVLENRSPVDTVEASDVLASFYFDIRSGTGRPTLALTSGSGAVWKVQSGTGDVEYRYVPQTFTQVSGSLSDLVARNNGDASWQFRPLDAAKAPFLGFGIGTVGNTGLAPNGFTPAVVGPPGNGMINFGIYKGGDIDPQGVLDGKYLVKNTATFRFSGVGGLTEAAIGRDVAFGLGTSPDSVIFLPEPSRVGHSWLAALAAAWLTRGRPGRISRTRHSGP